MSKITNDQNIQEWTEKADYVVEKFTEQGDFYRQHVLNPALFSLLGDVKGKTILDAGSGEGYLARMLSKQGAKVTAVEPAEGLITHALEREKKENLGITYIKADLSKWDAVPNSFDIVVSNMVFMDIPDYQSAIRNCISALKSKGLFIFSISHPCFDIKGHWEEDKPYVQVTDYFSEYNIQNYIGYSFHHMLSAYVNFLIEQGCSIAKMLEPRLPLEIAKDNKRFERDRNIPNFLLIKAIKE
jgi:2-polyprenyl-3-methyl-5-hydroxy-6-metoxy-1,4-benzoquinol methylase